MTCVYECLPLSQWFRKYNSSACSSGLHVPREAPNSHRCDVTRTLQAATFPGARGSTGQMPAVRTTQSSKLKLLSSLIIQELGAQLSLGPQPQALLTCSHFWPLLHPQWYGQETSSMGSLTRALMYGHLQRWPADSLITGDLQSRRG